MGFTYWFGTLSRQLHDMRIVTSNVYKYIYRPNSKRHWHAEATCAVGAPLSFSHSWCFFSRQLLVGQRTLHKNDRRKKKHGWFGRRSTLQSNISSHIEAETDWWWCALWHQWHHLQDETITKYFTHNSNHDDNMVYLNVSYVIIAAFGTRATAPTYIPQNTHRNTHRHSQSS